MRIHRGHYVTCIAVMCFYISIRLCVITYNVTLPETEITDVVDVIVTAQPLAAVGAEGGSTTATTTSNNDDGKAGDPLAINCTERDLRLPEHITARCPNSTTCADISCSKLLTARLNPIPDTTINNYMSRRTSARRVSDSDLVKLAANCTEFLRSRGFYRNTSSSREDADDFPLAFNILTHRDADQLARLLRAIYRPHNIYCIHVDARSPADFQSAVHHLTTCFHNVRLASKFEPIVYAGYSRLQADITCMQDNLHSDVHWKYLINTAAQAFPLKTVEEMVKV